MDLKKMKLSGILFMVAGVIFIATGLLGERMVFFVLGCSFIAIGGAFLARSRG